MNKRINPLTDFGYQPDPQLAQRLMNDLILELNGPIVMKKRTNSAERPQRVRFKKPSEPQRMLRELVSKWMLSGPHIETFLAGEPELTRYAKRFNAPFYPGPGARGYLLPRTDALPAVGLADQKRAYMYMMTLITNQCWTQLGGPCPECNDFFLKKRKLQKYCTRACSSSATATIAMKEKRLKEQEDKASLANALIEQWIQQRPRTGWKQWVKQRGNFTLHWLTRAANDNRIHAPRAD